MSIRLPAQWEKQKSIIVVFPIKHKDWQHSIREIQLSYVNFINTLREFQLCIVVCENPEILDSFFDSLENIVIYKAKTDDTWIRDFGAIDFYKDGKLKSYDFRFNAWGDKFSSSLDDKFNILYSKKNLIQVEFILEGGSIDTNGKGDLLTTSKCLFNSNRNSKYSDDEILQKLKKLFGLKRIVVLNHGHLKGDDTDSHIDTLARFIDEDSIAYVKCYDKNDEHFKELKKMEEELKMSSFRLIPLPLPSAKYHKNRRLPATYLNFIFINGALIVPTYGDKNDKIVIEILKNEIDDREVRGVDASIFIREYGSLHCSCINNFCEDLEC